VTRAEILAAARQAAPSSDIRHVGYSDQEYAEREAMAALAELAAAWRLRLSRPKRLAVLQRWGVLVPGVAYDLHAPFPLVRRPTPSRRGVIVQLQVDEARTVQSDVEAEIDAWFEQAQQEEQT
jgi:hypothetical protein